MPKIRELDKVEADYPLSGANHTVLRQPMPVSSDVLFNCLADGAAWKEWLGIGVEWTSPEPRGEGTTRTVTGNGQRMEEWFFTWEPGSHFSFRFDRATLPLKAFAEHYRCESTGPSTSDLVWSYSYEWGGPLKALMGPAFGAFFRFNCKRGLKKLTKLLATQGDRWAAA